MDKQIIQKLIDIVGEKAVLADKARMLDYSHDELSAKEIARDFLPDLVVKPQDTQQVSKILALANKENIPVTTRGGGTGLCGGSIPVKAGIVLSLERMNKLIEIDKINRVAIVESGMLLGDFSEKIEDAGLFFPPHPGDKNAQIGGVIATNAGGSRAVKYGTIRNYIRGLEVVLADARILNLGGKFAKNSSGYNILNLLIGSEGTLGVITKATIALIFPPNETATLLIPFPDLSGAIRTVPDILHAGLLPIAVEFMEDDIIDYAQRTLEYKFPVKKAAAYLLITFDANSKDELDKICHKAAEISVKNKAEDVFVADLKKRQKELLEFRSKFYDVLKPDMVEDMDLVVPVSEIVKLVEFVHKLQSKYDIKAVTYGHAADGNVHVHIMKGQSAEKLSAMKKELYHKTKELGGMLSGEHGIGFIKVNELPDFVGKDQIELMKNIKNIFDPKGILNPSKIFK